MGQEIYNFDAIVVGSGITGGWAAKELCEKGLKTIMLERGKDLEHVSGYHSATKAPWEFSYRGSLTPADKEKFKIQTRHFSIKEENKHLYCNDQENPYHEEQRYDWIRADVLGGRSLLWGRMSFRWSDFDFEANLKDGLGIDWPIRYKDIAPWYEYVERFVGISGQAAGLPTLPDSVFQQAMPLNCIEDVLKTKVEGAFPERHVIPGRVANLTSPLPGRSACQYRNLCDRGCPYGAYFSTQSSTLPAAKATGNLTIRTNALANRILYDEKTRKAVGVEMIDTITGKTYEYRAKVIFINAAALGSAFLLLNSKTNSFPNGLGNNNDVVGRYLMDHHRSGAVVGSFEGFEDRYYFGRKPTGFFIPRFVNYGEEKRAYVRGYNCQGNGTRGKNKAEGIGTDLKSLLTEPGQWQLSMNAYGECLPYADNHVTLHPTLTDKWGRPALSISCSFRDNEKKMREDSIQTMQEMLETAGAKDIRVVGSMSVPGNANHEMGTIRMGYNSSDSALDKWNRLHEVKNVYVTDGSCMTSSASVNPSLTYMALTARAADHAVRALRNGDI